jgi:FkbM family methyltransferase
MVRLPWGLDIVADPGEDLGRIIIRNGVFDLTVSEALSRLLAPGETGVDVGANIGYMTSIMAARAGTKGRVIAFEPHPDVNRDLAANVARWRTAKGVGPIEVHAVALSDEHGSGTLFMRANFARNRGLASFEAPSGPTPDGWVTEEVTLKRLDEVVKGPISVMKIDVEGHELQVLRGATTLLEDKLVRDIIFEEHGRYPTPVTELLEDAGFTLFWLDRSFSGPRLRRPDDPPPAGNEDPSFVASIDPERVQALLAPNGWRALGLRTIPIRFRRAVE